MTHTSTEQPSLAAIIHDLRESHARTSPGAWGKGATTHETVSRAEGREPYKVAEFRHANDAQFCDLAHVFVPRLLSEIEALQSRVQELEASQTQRVPLNAFQRRAIFDDLYPHGATSQMWQTFSVIVTAVERFYSTQE